MSAEEREALGVLNNAIVALQDTYGALYAGLITHVDAFEEIEDVISTLRREE